MKQCKHCASRYRSANGQGEFCCAGCEHVFEMIRENGLGDYYTRQDRMGQPVGDRPFSGLDYVSINQLQNQAENAYGCKITARVQGMSCLGCAWLVEQLVRRQNGVLSARVALDSSRLSLEWEQGRFDLCKLAEDLHTFGYRLIGDNDSSGLNFSPLAMRLGLTLVFSFNGLLLLAAADNDIGGAGLRQFYNLLIIVCLFFSQLIGGTLFLKPAWRGLMLRRLHSDALPALALFVLFLLALPSLFDSSSRMLPASIYFFFLPTMVFARWLSEVRILKMRA